MNSVWRTSALPRRGSTEYWGEPRSGAKRRISGMVAAQTAPAPVAYEAGIDAGLSMNPGQSAPRTAGLMHPDHRPGRRPARHHNPPAAVLRSPPHPSAPDGRGRFVGTAGQLGRAGGVSIVSSREPLRAPGDAPAPANAPRRRSGRAGEGPQSQLYPYPSRDTGWPPAQAGRWSWPHR